MNARALAQVRGAVLAAVLPPALVFSRLHAQQPGVIRGTVRAATDSAPLATAVVMAPAVRGRPVTTTAPSGAFTLRVPAGQARLVAAAIGFAPETLEVTAGSMAVAFVLHPAPVTLEPVAVAAERVYSAASSGAVRALDIRLRPRESSQELLRLVPGLLIAQHAGGGKAEQILLRGFDADHGTDVARDDSRWSWP